MRGNASYLESNGVGVAEIPQAPLLVRFVPAGSANGQVVVATFHIDAQNDFVIDQMLRTVVGDFKENDPEAVQIGE